MGSQDQPAVNHFHPNDDSYPWDVNNVAMKDVFVICLHQIFKHLNVTDLFIMAFVSTDFRYNAVIEFKRKFGLVTIEIIADKLWRDLRSKENRIQQTDRIVLEQEKFIKPLNMLTFIRIFGNCNTTINVMSRTKKIHRIQDYLLIYCKQTNKVLENRDPLSLHTTLQDVQMGSVSIPLCQRFQTIRRIFNLFLHINSFLQYKRNNFQ